MHMCILRMYICIRYIYIHAYIHTYIHARTHLDSANRDQIMEQVSQSRLRTLLAIPITVEYGSAS